MDIAAKRSLSFAGAAWWKRLGSALALDYAFRERVGDGGDVAGRVRATQIAAVGRFSRMIMLANICNAAVLLAFFARSPKANIAVLWTFTLVAYSLVVYLRSRARNGEATPHYVSRRGIRHALINALVLGVLWGAVPILFFGETAGEQLIVTCLITGMMCAGCFVLAPIPVVAATFVTPITLGSGIALLRSIDHSNAFIFALLVSYVVVLLGASVAYATQLVTRVREQADAERTAMLDSLTQLPNRMALLARLDAAVERCSRFSESFALLSIDLDGFKAVNDRFGHPAGDRLLTHVARTLSSAVRPSDMLARVGGDEFAMLVHGVHTPDEAATIAERLLALVAGRFAFGGEDMRTGLSIGIVRAPSDGLTASTLLERADGALYEAKRNGRNGFRLFQAHDDLMIRRRMEWMRDLHKAVERKQFFLVFQPIVDMRDGRISKFEALLRWRHHKLGIISPSDFIPAAESSGLIHEIGDFVIDEACRVASTWPDNVRIAVNFSLDQFRSLKIVQTVKDALARYDLPSARFEIEVTESVLFQDESVILQTVRAFDQANMRLVLDDFGTGYSSLRNLQDLPIGGVKIDRGFTSGLPDNRRSEAIVRSVVDLCRALEIRVTAEGVETAEQMEMLRGIGCDNAQGFWISRPLDEAGALSLCAPRAAAGRLVA